MRTDQDFINDLQAIGMPAEIIADFTNQCGWCNDFARLMKGELAVVLLKHPHIPSNPFRTLLELKIEFQKQWLILDETDMRFGAPAAVHGKNKRLYFVGVKQLNRSSDLIEAYWEVPNENAN